MFCCRCDVFCRFFGILPFLAFWHEKTAEADARRLNKRNNNRWFRVPRSGKLETVSILYHGANIVNSGFPHGVEKWQGSRELTKIVRDDLVGIGKFGN